MMVWAVVAAVTAVVHSYTGLVLVRFFLGKPSLNQHAPNRRLRKS